MKISKYLTAVAVALALPALMKAAEPTGNVPFVSHARPSRLVSFGVHVADGVASIRQNYPDQIGSVGSFTLTPGNSFAIGATAVLNIREFIGIGTSLDFSINNYYYDLTVLNANGTAGTLTSLYSKNRFTTFEIPLFVQLSMNISRQVKWENRLGLYMSFGAGGYTDNTTFRSSTNELGQSQVNRHDYRTDYYKADDGLINRLSDTDYGLHVSTGLVIYEHYTLGADLNVGLHNIASNFGVYDTSVRTLTARVRIGYKF